MNWGSKQELQIYFGGQEVGLPVLQVVEPGGAYGDMVLVRG